MVDNNVAVRLEESAVDFCSPFVSTEILFDVIPRTDALQTIASRVLPGNFFSNSFSGIILRFFYILT